MECHHENLSLIFQDHGNIFLTLLIAGVVGSFTHCAGMCGPFVMGQVCSKSDDIKGDSLSEFSRLKAGALLPYHLGRSTTYTMLGIAATILTRELSDLSFMKYLTAGLLMLAGAIFIFTALKGLGIIKFSRQIQPSKIANIISKISTPLMANSRGIKGYFLGLLLGFLPCGFLYAAIITVASTADPLIAGLAMIVFTIGTIPALFMIGIGGQFGINKWKKKFQRFGRLVMGLNGIGLFYMAIKNFV